jgi:LytS/YehU family sensor histidine kinase
MMTIAALMAALSNILSTELFTIPLAVGPIVSRVHFTQIPIFLSGILAGPWAGLLTGAVGGLYMSFTMIPFVFGGLALLGFMTGYVAKRFKFRPFLSAILAWVVQAAYVYVTDYFWFTSVQSMPGRVATGVVTTILMKLTVEAVIAAILVEVVVLSLGRTGLLSVLGER